MQRADSLERTLMLRKTEGKRRRLQQRMRWLDGIPDSTDTNSSKLREIVKDRKACQVAAHGVTELDPKQLNNNKLPVRKKAREFQKNIYFCFIDYAKAFDCVDHNKLENS